MTMDRVYNPHQQQQQPQHGFQQQPTQPMASVVATHLHRHHHQHHNPVAPHVPHHQQYLQQQQQSQQSSSSESSTPPPPPPHPPPLLQTQIPHHRHTESISFPMQQTSTLLYRGNQFHHQHQLQTQPPLLDKNQFNHHHHYRDDSHTQLSVNSVSILQRPVHPPPPPPPLQPNQHSMKIDQQVPSHLSHFVPPMTTSKQKPDDDMTTSTNIMRNSLPTVVTKASEIPSEADHRNSLQHNFYNDTNFQYYQPSNLRRHPTHHNKFVDQQQQNATQQISSQTAVNITTPPMQLDQQTTTTLMQTDDSGHMDLTTQEHFTEEIIQAILAAKDALEKPSEERDEHDILLIDNLCSLVHGFDSFPKSVRRSLAAQALLIVVDEKGKELIIHNEELDSFCVLIFGECEQVDQTRTVPIRHYNVGDAFGVCEPTTETVKFNGYMITRCENCAFLCVKSDDFYSILTDPANYPTKETIRHRDRNGNIICVSQFSLDRKTAGPPWSYHMQSKPHKIVLPDGHVIVKANEACLLAALVDGYERVDSYYIDDFLLLFRVFMSWDQKDKEKRLPPGMIKLCLTLTKWLDQTEYRDKVVKIVLTWLSSYYHDFELDSDFSYLFFKLLESRLLNLSMSNQLHLLHVTLSTKSKVRRVEIPRPSREQPLFFSIAGGYEKNCGIFVTQVHGSTFEECPADSLMSYLNHTSQTNSIDKMGLCGPAIPPRLRSAHNNLPSSISECTTSKKLARLRPGDQILEVNKTNFSAIKLSEAQKVLDSATLLNLTVKYNPSAYHEMRALPEGRRKSSMSSLPSASPFPQSAQRFTFNVNDQNLNRVATNEQSTPISPLFSANANFGFRSLIKNAPKNDRSRLFNLINSSKQLVKQIRDSTGQSINIETSSKTSDNISDDQSNDIDMGKAKSSSDLHNMRGKDKQLESGLSNIVSSDDLNPAAMLENSGNGTAGQTFVNVLRVFNAANNDSRYLLIHEETTAREVVMVAVKEFNLTGGSNPSSQGSTGEKSQVSSLNWRLYEVSVVPESRTIKKSCLGEQENRLAERNSLCSRFYIKNNAQSSMGPTKLDMGDDALVNEILKESPPSVSLTSLNATLLAVELTLADFDKFRGIEPQQFVYDTFFNCSEKAEKCTMSTNGSISSHDSASLKSSSSDSQESSSDSLHSLNRTRNVPKRWMLEYNKFADISNREMFWVICEILNERNISRRVKIVKQFVRVADVCSQLRNYNSMFAIISGLGHSCVARLRRTFEKLKPKYKNQLEKMRSLFDPSRNMLNYRNCLAHTQPPAIPLFPQIKKDLTFTKEGRSIFVREPNDLSDEDESGFSQDTIKRKSRGGDLLTVKSATMNSIDDTDRDLASVSHTRSMSHVNFSNTNFSNNMTRQSSESDSILINFAEIRQFTDRVRNVIYFSSVPYSSDLLTNTKESQRTQAIIKKMHEEWQMRKRIRHYLVMTLQDSNLESSPSSSGRSSQAQSNDKLDQVDGLSMKPSNGRTSITYDERVLYQKSLEVESDFNPRPQTTSEPRQVVPSSAVGQSVPAVHSVQTTHLHLPPPQVAPILNIPQQLQPTAASSSPTLSKSSSLSSCSSFSHHLPNYHQVRGGSNLSSSAVGKFGTESTESLRKLQALSENVDDWRSSSCNNNSNGGGGANGHHNNGLSRIASDGRGGLVPRNLVPSRMFPPKNGK